MSKVEKGPRQWVLRPGSPRPCTECGRPFRPLVRNSKYCSPPCRRKADKAQRAAKKHGGPSTVDISPPRKWED